MENTYYIKTHRDSNVGYLELPAEVPVELRRQEIPPGVYVAIPPSIDNPTIEIRSEKLMETDCANIIMDEQKETVEYIDRFFSKNTIRAFAEIGTMWKLGIMLHGMPGTGKTVAINMAVNRLVHHGCVVLVNPYLKYYNHFIDMIRLGNPGTPIAFVYDECEQVMNDWELRLLEILDGSQSVPGTIFLCATNHLHRIPGRILQRPSRFQYLREFGVPGEDIVKQYVSDKLKGYSKYSDKLVKDITDAVIGVGGLVIDEVKAVLINSITLDQDPKECAQRYAHK